MRSESEKKAAACARARVWYADNKERAVATRRAYAKANQDKVKVTHAEWVAANKEKVRGIKAKYRAKHAERLAEDQKARRAANPEARRATIVKYEAANKDKLRKSVQTRRAKKAGATTRWDAELDALVLAEAPRLQLAREAATGIKWDLDHIVPLRGTTVCGLHNAHNVAVVPQRYNQAKGCKFPFIGWLEAP